MVVRFKGRNVVIDKDLGFRKILRLLGTGPVSATTGIQDSEAEVARDELTNAALGAIHEFGVDLPEQGIRIPERSFVRVPFDRNVKRLERLLGAGMREVAGGTNTVERVFGVAAEFLRGQMVAAIDDGIEPPLADSTIARKGSSKQLIDTGQLKQSITSKVTRGKVA